MKKFIFKIILGVLGTMILAMPALAVTTLSLSPSSTTVTQGQSFNVVVKVDPKGIKNYTVKMQLQYPADILEVKYFTFSGRWMAISQSGYDLVDNTNGVLIKTAGYPSGFSGNITFGTVSFLAKKPGTGIIKVGNGSIVLNVKSQNVLGDLLGEASVTIEAPSVEKIPPKEEISTPTHPLFDVSIEPVRKQIQKKSLLPIFITAGIILIIIAAYIIYRKKKKNLL